MAITVQALITRSLRLLSEINSGQAPTLNESNDALVSLNTMLDAWRRDRLLCYALQEQAIPLTQGMMTQTVGPTGGFVTTRPVKVESARVDVGVISYNVKIIEEQEYSIIGLKTQQQSYPLRMWYQPSFPNATIYLWPVPSQPCTLYISTWTPILPFVNLTDTISLPPGWERALTANLALEMAPEYQTDPADGLIKIAAESLKLLRRANSQPVRMYFDNSLLGSANYYSNGQPV